MPMLPCLGWHSRRPPSKGRLMPHLLLASIIARNIYRNAIDYAIMIGDSTAAYCYTRLAVREHVGPVAWRQIRSHRIRMFYPRGIAVPVRNYHVPTYRLDGRHV